jgi:PAS domain S-box-containing protein
MLSGRADWRRRVTLGIGVTVGAFCAAVFLAWYAHFIPLIQISPGWPPLTREGSLTLLLSAASLAFLAGGRERTSAVFASVVIVLGMLICFEYILDRSLGIDELLGSGYIVESGAAPGRASPFAAICYLGTGIALFALSNRRASRHAPAIAGIIASVLVAAGSVVVLTYLMRHTSTYAWHHSRRISVQSATALALLGLGIMILAAQESRSRKAMPRWLPLGIGLGLAVGALGVWQVLNEHEVSEHLLISNVIVGGGMLGALLVAALVDLAQKSTLRNRELQEGKAEFERLFEASLDGLLVTDRDGRIVGANRSVQTLFGYDRDEIIGASIENLMPTGSRDLHGLHRKQYWADPTARPMGRGLELRGLRKDGSEFLADVSLSPLRLEEKLRVLAAVRDVTDHKQAQEALRESEERFRGVFETSPVGLALIGTDYRLAKVNPALVRMLGYSEAELMNMNPFDLTHPEDREMSKRWAERLFGGEIPSYQVEKRYVRKTGEIIWVTLTATILRDHQGRLLFGLGVIEDITQRKQAREALRRSEEQFRGVFEQGPIGITLLGRDYRLAKVNAALCRMLGYSESELMTMSPIEYTHPDDRDATVNVVERLFSTEAPIRAWEKRYVKKSGEVIWANLTASLLHDQQGRPLYGMGMIEDITERKRAEEELRTLNERLSLATRIASVGVWDWDMRTNVVVWDDAAFEMFGLPKVNPLRYEDYVSRVHPDDLAKIRETEERVVREKTRVSLEFRIFRTDGALRYLSVAAGPVIDERGNVVRMVGLAIDITERKRAEEELRILNQRLSLAARSASMGIWEFDLRTEIAIWNDRLFEIFGIPQKAQVAREDWERLIRQEDLGKIEAFIAAVVSGKTQEAIEYQITRPDGALRYLSVMGGAVLDNDGNVTGMVGIALDITERKELQIALEASARLSALGMMAGGVAHEINNPLSVIHAMASDLVEMAAAEGLSHSDVVARKGSIIRETAERIARIVKSLRQISREGSGDRFHPTSLSKIVNDTLEICRAKFKAHSVELLLPGAIPEMDIPCREVQIEQALLNLLQNAFDAVVEQQGERWVRLRVAPGHGSVAISVMDSGPGIPAELRPRLMEPFFTTKPVGKGTGLGLSLSKTIAEDHGGRLEYSEDHGHTCFSLVLPMARKAEAA